MDFQITIHGIGARTVKHTAPWFVKVRTDVSYLYKTRALMGVDLEFREKFEFAEWDKSIKLEVWKAESTGMEFSLIAVVPLDFPSVGSYSTSFDLFSEKTTGKLKSSNSALLTAGRLSPAAVWRDPIAHVKVTVVHLSGFKARSKARLKILEEDSLNRSRGSEMKTFSHQVDETKSTAAQSMKLKTLDQPIRPPVSAQSMKQPLAPQSPKAKPLQTKWISMRSDEGDEYYFNTETEETTWEMPDDFDGAR